MSYTTIDAIATGNPPLRRSQEEAADFMASIDSLPDALQSRLPALYRGSSIQSRYTCVDDYGRDDPEEFTFFPQTWTLEPAPTTEDRNEHYRESVVPLAEDVASRALEEADADPESITHVIAVSCTGFFAPGLDVELVKRLDLPPTTQRTFIGFMGCYAAFNALKVAIDALAAGGSVSPAALGAPGGAKPSAGVSGGSEIAASKAAPGANSPAASPQRQPESGASPRAITCGTSASTTRPAPRPTPRPWPWR